MAVTKIDAKTGEVAGASVDDTDATTDVPRSSPAFDCAVVHWAVMAGSTETDWPEAQVPNSPGVIVTVEPDTAVTHWISHNGCAPPDAESVGPTAMTAPAANDVADVNDSEVEPNGAVAESVVVAVTASW